MANDKIYSFDSSESISKFKNLYTKLKAELSRRNIPSYVNNSRLSQFVNTTYNNLPSTATLHKIIDFEIIHQTANRIRNAINGKALKATPYTDTNMKIKESDINADINFVNSLASITDLNSGTTGCNAICIGICKGACYSSCNGCSGCSGVRGDL